jgi:predicted GH43/DUF377 family glycosyl hydrolase
MLKKMILCSAILLTSLSASAKAHPNQQKLVVASTKIYLEDFPDAWNPSMIKTEEGFLMSFRYTPDRDFQPWLSYIGIVLLNDLFQPISKPELLSPRLKNSKTPSQAEDARIFRYQDKLFLIYNDNVDIIYPSYSERRDMFIAELLYANDHFTLSPPLKLIYEEKYTSQLWQKNWVPFEKDGTLLLSYSMNPHEVLYLNLNTGVCYPCHETSPPIRWNFGTLRGSSSALLVDGEYLAFFHSGIITSSPASWGIDLWHYFMGAYTFSAEPPFEITRMTPVPIIGEDFYTPSNSPKRVIFPGGFVVSDSFIYVAYGKDDREIWVATLDKTVLKNSMVPIEGMSQN